MIIEMETSMRVPVFVSRLTMDTPVPEPVPSNLIPALFSDETSFKGNSDDCIPARDQYKHCQQEDDLSEPLINLKRTVGRKVSVCWKKKATVTKQNHFISTDILEGRKSASFLADEGRTPSAAKTKELLVYKRTRFRGTKASLELEKIQGARVDILAPSQVVEAADMPTSTQPVNDINDRESLNVTVKKNDSTEMIAGERELVCRESTNMKLRKKYKQLNLNHLSHGLSRKEYMKMRRERQKKLVALKRSGMAMPRQLMMPLFTTKNVPLGDTWSKEELDALWIGVRWHGEGNWESILRDPKLQFLSYKKTEHLFERWAMEKVNTLGIDRNEEPLTHPQQPLTAEVHPQPAKLARGTLIKRSSHQMGKIAAGSSKRQTLMIGGAFPLSKAIIREFKQKEEVSSEGTISDW